MHMLSHKLNISRGLQVDKVRCPRVLLKELGQHEVSCTNSPEFSTPSLFSPLILFHWDRLHLFSLVQGSSLQSGTVEWPGESLRPLACPVTVLLAT